MEHIGLVCFNCKPWIRHNNITEFNPTEDYIINVIIHCPNCDPEYFENLIKENE